MEKKSNRVSFKENNMQSSHFILPFISFLIITGIRIFGPWGNNKPLCRLKDMFSPKNIHFLFGLIGVVSWSSFILGFDGAKYMTNDNDTYNSYIEATKRAVLAFIIALFAKLDLTIPVFWLIWLTAFYLDGWN